MYGLSIPLSVLSFLYSQSDLLLAVGTLKFLLEPAMNAARMENMTAMQGFHLRACSKNLEANRAADLFLLSLDLLTFALCEALLLGSTSLVMHLGLFLALSHAH